MSLKKGLFIFLVVAVFKFFNTYECAHLCVQMEATISEQGSTMSKPVWEPH